MNSRQHIKCKNESCSKELHVVVNDSKSIPIIFCGEECINSFLNSEFSRKQTHYEDPKEINKLVQNVIDYTKQIQDELDKFKKIRSTYFELFKGDELKNPLKGEYYTREWSFEKENK